MTPARLIASGFGSGLVRFAPGTAGSFVAVILGAGIMHLSPPLPCRSPPPPPISPVYGRCEPAGRRRTRAGW